MSAETKLIPAGSQTVGPFFRIGLQRLVDCAPPAIADAVTIHGRVLDRDGAPVPDAMLEFWSAASDGATAADGFPRGFRRAATDLDGAFSVTLQRPGVMENQAPHLLVLVFARGLLRHLITRLYFEDDAANDADAVLLSIAEARRSTLIARGDGEDSFCWDVKLQGTDETVFFAW